MVHPFPVNTHAVLITIIGDCNDTENRDYCMIFRFRGWSGHIPFLQLIGAQLIR